MLVYILYSKQIDRYYIGQTEDLSVRLNQHLTKVLPHSYTQLASDWEVFFTIDCDSRKQAVGIENHIKKMKSSQYIRNLKTYPEIVEKLKLKYN
ncbi:MAG: GIY-YIG nuclease family protein [Flammeovirgaceae bacterium]|jgi:putative endonuclease|nr:GIY-YIG nuclease family protein [Flammeovirgaceae bacterium]